MRANKNQYTKRYFLSIIVAMGLNILPLSNVWKSLNPDWVLLVLIYWTLTVPERVGVFNAWILGIFVDVLTGRLLGMHGLIYALINYTCLKFHRRLRNYPVLQQALFVFFCLLVSQVLVFWIENIQGTAGLSWFFWLPVLTGTLCWPFVYSGLRLISLIGHID
jgi:rod shape-determining protein MreD